MAYGLKAVKMIPVILMMMFLVSPLASTDASANTVIDSDTAKETVISIYKKQPEDSEVFCLRNMFPGDSETMTYLVEVSHKGTVTVRFHADIRENSEKLAEVLKCRIALSGEMLFDGLMREMPESVNHAISSTAGQTIQLAYEITVYLDTSVGNEYMGKELTADFRWWVEESGTEPTSPETEENVGVDDTVKPGGGELIAPDTGDDSRLGAWLCIAAVSLLVMIILLWRKRQENDGKRGM